MTAHTRADLESLRVYVPGRSIPGAVKLASNEVPEGPLPSVVAAIADAAVDVNRYPDNGVTALLERLAARLDMPQSHLAAGCGSVTLCQQLVEATCGRDDEVLFAWPSFEAYPLITQIAGVRRRTVPLRPDHTHDLTAMLDAITPATRLVFVCNPNNPTGTAVRRDELVAFLDAVPSGVLVALDEAYYEFVTDPKVPDGVALCRENFGRDNFGRDNFGRENFGRENFGRENFGRENFGRENFGRDNIAVLRTFSKAYGLAGLRVGYCVAPEPIITALHKVYVPFSVNSLAQVAALASLDVADELLARCQRIAAERDRVRAELLTMGYPVPDSQANFVWLPLGERTAVFDDHCQGHKIVIRAYPGTGARITISTPADNELFLTAARTFPR